MNHLGTLVLRCSRCHRKLARVTHPLRWDERGGGREFLRITWRPDVEVTTYGSAGIVVVPGGTTEEPQSYAATCPGRYAGEPCRRPIRIRHDSLVLWWADEPDLNAVPTSSDRVTRDRLV